MKKKSILAFVLLIAMAGMAFTGCTRDVDPEEDDEYYNEDMEFDSLGFKDTAGKYYSFDEATDTLSETEYLVFTDDGKFEYYGENEIRGTYAFDTSDYAYIIGSADGKVVFEAWYADDLDYDFSETKVRVMEIQWATPEDSEEESKVIGFFNNKEAAIYFGYSLMSKVLGPWKNTSDPSKADDYRTFNKDGTFESGCPDIDGMTGKRLGTYGIVNGNLVCTFDDGHTEVFSMTPDEVFTGDISYLEPVEGTSVTWMPGHAGE